MSDDDTEDSENDDVAELPMPSFKLMQPSRRQNLRIGQRSNTMPLTQSGLSGNGSKPVHTKQKSVNSVIHHA